MLPLGLQTAQPPSRNDGVTRWSCRPGCGCCQSVKRDAQCCRRCQGHQQQPIISQAVVRQVRALVYCGPSSQQRPGCANSEMGHEQLGLAACPASLLPASLCCVTWPSDELPPPSQAHSTGPRVEPVLRWLLLCPSAQGRSLPWIARPRSGLKAHACGDVVAALTAQRDAATSRQQGA